MYLSTKSPGYYELLEKCKNILNKLKNIEKKMSFHWGFHAVFERIQWGSSEVSFESTVEGK